MVVEDEYFVRVMIAGELRGSGYQVVECSTADEALEVLKAGANISIIFTDIRMPGSMDGITLAEVVKAQFPDLPVVVTSGQPLNGFAPAHFVPKPYDPRRVRRFIDLLLTNIFNAAAFAVYSAALNGL